MVDEDTHALSSFGAPEIVLLDVTMKGHERNRGSRAA